MSEPADWKRAQRERAVRDGVCFVCCAAPARPRLKTCLPCSEAAYARVKARRERIASSGAA